MRGGGSGDETNSGDAQLELSLSKYLLDVALEFRSVIKLQLYEGEFLNW